MLKEGGAGRDRSSLGPALTLHFWASLHHVFSSLADDFTEEEEVQSFGYKRFGEF